MYPLLISQNAQLPVRMLDGAGAPVTGLSSVSVSVHNGDGTISSYTASGSNWVEVSIGVFSGLGFYTLTVPGANITAVGAGLVAVKHASTAVSLIEISVDFASLESIATSVNGVQSTVNSSATSAQMLAIIENVGIIDARQQIMEGSFDEFRQLTAGRWKIHTSGLDANRMVIYAEDGTTPLAKYDLKNAAGAASTTTVFERVPV